MIHRVSRESSGLHGTSRVSHHHRVKMMRVSVKKQWVVHQRRDTGSRGPWRGVGIVGGEEEDAGGRGDPDEEGAPGGDVDDGVVRAWRW